ncbi:alpha/beta fold hydrolase [Kitasatospora sp. NPDC004240]
MTQLPTALAVRESGTGTPIVLLHAFPLNASMWGAQLDGLPGLTGDGARVLAPDQRGFGGTELGGGEPSLEAVADDVALLLDAAGIERAVIGGLSMGGYAALAFARRHPGRLSGLLLAGTKATEDTEAARANRERIASAVLARDSVALLIEEKMERTLLGPDSGALAGRVRELIGQAPPRSVAWAQRAMAARTDTREVLAGLTVPVAVVVGSADIVTPPAESELMAAAAPDAELTVIPGAGHLSAMEAPEEFNAAVRRLLARVAG